MIFIADIIACSTCFGHHYVHHQELESIIQVAAACGIWWFGFQVVGMVWGWRLCVRFAGSCGHILFPHVNDDARSKSHKTYYVMCFGHCSRYWQAFNLRYSWLFIFLVQESILLAFYFIADAAKDPIIFIRPEHKGNTIPKCKYDVLSQQTWIFSNTALSQISYFLVHI
jgi:hypothetical protein